MMQNRLKDNNRGGYVDDRYRSHDNFTNAFNMLAQIGLAEKEVTNSMRNAVTQAANVKALQDRLKFDVSSQSAKLKQASLDFSQGQQTKYQEIIQSYVDSQADKRRQLLNKWIEQNDKKYNDEDFEKEFKKYNQQIYEEDIDAAENQYKELLNSITTHSEESQKIIQSFDDMNVFNILSTEDVRESNNNDNKSFFNSWVTINPKIWDEMMQEEQVGLESHEDKWEQILESTLPPLHSDRVYESNEDTLDQNLELTSPQYHPNITNLLITQTPTQVEKNPFWQHYDGPSHKGFQNLGKKLAKFFTKWGGWVNTTEESFDSLLGKFNTGGNR